MMPSAASWIKFLFLNARFNTHRVVAIRDFHPPTAAVEQFDLERLRNHQAGDAIYLASNCLISSWEKSHLTF